jgi:4a-hydroxytetrahydrobiopterin dehydratase
MEGLAGKNCVPYPKGSAALSDGDRDTLGRVIPAWSIIDGVRLRREYRFKTYLDGVQWVQLIGKVADEQDHHPDIHVLYRKVLVELWTHTVNGLSENDFIVAAKFDQLYEAFDGRKI